MPQQTTIIASMTYRELCNSFAHGAKPNNYDVIKPYSFKIVTNQGAGIATLLDKGSLIPNIVSESDFLAMLRRSKNLYFYDDLHEIYKYSVNAIDILENIVRSRLMNPKLAQYIVLNNPNCFTIEYDANNSVLIEKGAKIVDMFTAIQNTANKPISDIIKELQDTYPNEVDNLMTIVQDWQKNTEKTKNELQSLLESAKK